MIISPYAVSYNSIREQLENYVQSSTDFTKVWKDFYPSGAGQTIIELDAAVAAFLFFHYTIGRRETFITTAQNYNSVVGGGEALGYNAKRGHVLYVHATITPSITRTLPKWTILGQYGEYDVTLMEQVTLTKDEPKEIWFAIGNSSAQTINITSNEIQQFVFTADNVTDDCRLLLQSGTNTTQLPIATELKQAIEDKYILLTNAYGAVDVLYLQEGNYKYQTSDTLILHYLERNEVTTENFNKDSLNLDYFTDISKFTFEDVEGPEDIEHVRTASKLYHETNNVVRARKDFCKYLLETNTSLIERRLTSEEYFEMKKTPTK